ncbi:MAG: hypothetical protein HGA45_19775 [Chloroflexales bacterium]|nr:hypothetical protein [Chloroflexales bacterium]
MDHSVLRGYCAKRDERVGSEPLVCQVLQDRAKHGSGGRADVAREAQQPPPDGAGLLGREPAGDERHGPTERR